MQSVMNSCGFGTIAILLTWLPGRLAHGENPAPRDPKASAGLVREFLASLDDPARTSVQFAFDVAERRRWRRDPAPRPGLAIKDMTDAQRALLNRLLESVLSDSGLGIVKGIMAEQDHLGENEEGLGSGYFWFAVYGQPGEGRWAWRLGGHHISLHLTYEGTGVVSATPLFLGGEIDGDPAKGWAGYESLRPREENARKLLDGCRLGDWNVPWYEEIAHENLVLSEPQSLPLGEPDSGIPLRRMDAALRLLARRLALEYIEVFEESIADKYRELFEKTGGDARFFWAGSKQAGEPHYYRLYGPGFLIEYGNTGAHTHTLLRTEIDFYDAPSADVGTRRVEAFRRAGEFGKAFDAFREIIVPDEKSLGALHDLLTDRRLQVSEDTRWGRDLLRRKARSAAAALIPPGEPGEPMVVAGFVRGTDDRPVPNALLYVFHADDSGRYTPERVMDEPNARLFAYLRSGPDGRYEFKTIYPGAYPAREDVEGDERFIPRHVHFEITADGFAFRRGQMVFDDDPRMTAHWRQWAQRNSYPVAQVTRGPDGDRRASCALVLEAK